MLFIYAIFNLHCTVDRCPDEGISTTVVQQIGEAFPLAKYVTFRTIKRAYI